MGRWSKDACLRYCSPTPKIILFGVGFILLAGIVKIFEIFTSEVFRLLRIDIIVDFRLVIAILLIVAYIMGLIAIIEKITRSDERDISYSIINRLCAYNKGNPLNLKDGELEPVIRVNKSDKGYKITVECQSAKFDDVSNLETVISDCLRNKYGNYAVVSKEEDIAGRYVDYYIEDVVTSYNKQSVYNSLNDVPTDLTKIYIRDDVYIDYSKVLNSSAVIAGRSRSGKTTAIISTFLLPILKQGRDNFNSKVIIVDPKSAELSLCPFVLSPDTNGSVEHILEAIRDFNNIRIERQQIVNEFCISKGKAIKWFDVGMKPCILFLDEFVSIQDMFPKKASKEKPNYSLTDFQGVLRQIATQGASAGCFLILSTAEASVGTGGLESAVNNACGIRILFKPSLDEARYLWSTEKLAVMRERQYVAGDAWFSADDGINNSVRFVKFPRLEFGEYEALSELLTLYYG
ncbi:MAG: hypothetical protein IJ763_04875 [Lachnospiraceae bacterium]|nr:hypothetical protein [Lachnospiraceae bacterium]